MTPSRAQFSSAFMLSGFGLETMLDLIRGAALPDRGARHRGSDFGRGDGLTRLAAIIAAEVAGHSRFMEADEQETLVRLRSLRHDPIDPNSTKGARSRPPATAC